GMYVKQSDSGWDAPVSLDVLKINKCHSPKAMLGYMMKNPITVISTDTSMLEIGYNMRCYGMHEKYLNKQKEKEAAPQVNLEELDMNKMVKDITMIMEDNKVFTIEECMKVAPECMAKYLHRPGLNAIVMNCASFVKATATIWNINKYAKDIPNPAPIHRVLVFQGLNTNLFDYEFYNWITKKHPKKNTFILQGPTNTGKSQFISGFKLLVSWGEILNSQSFNFEALQEKNFGVWEEPLISSELAEKFKQISEGMVTMIPIKYKKPVKLPRTPIMITTNHHIWRYCTQEEEMFKNRCFIYNFFNNTTSRLEQGERNCQHRCLCGCTDTWRSSESVDEHPSVSDGNSTSVEISTGADCSSSRNSGGFNSELFDAGHSVCTKLSDSGSDNNGSAGSLYCYEAISTDGSGSECSRSSATEHDERPTTSNRSRYTTDGVGDSETQLRKSVHIHWDSGSGNGRSDKPRKSGRKHNLGRRHHRLSGVAGGRVDKKQKTSLLGGTLELAIRATLDHQPPVERPACTCLRIPTKEDWKGYLSYLYHKNINNAC
ncbi:MAG: hypothetical protein RSC68_20000, partial [Acinetobacter sp.]